MPKRVVRPRYLGHAEFGARIGLTGATIRSYKRRGMLPEPDVIIEGSPPTHGWLTETIDEWAAHRPGPGHRTDRERARAEGARPRRLARTG